ncbi:MAG TPA: hypothetical protein V6C81_31865 [Planktothrix sp.]|jgi:hypothetical protein
MQKPPKMLEEYQSLVAARLRLHETRKAGDDEAKLKEIQDMGDPELLRKWMWLTAIVGGPISFIAVPFILSLFSTFLPVVVMAILWNIAKLAMGMVFIVFLLAVYFTTSVKSNG